MEQCEATARRFIFNPYVDEPDIYRCADVKNHPGRRHYYFPRRGGERWWTEDEGLFKELMMTTALPSHQSQARAQDHHMRPTVDQVWMDVARAVGQRSLCERAQVGAVVVSAQGRIEASGYNGPPAGYPVQGTCSLWCERSSRNASGTSYGLSCPSVHAEANALLYTDRSRIEGGTIYASRSCCADCAKLIANSGIKRVVMRVIPEDEHRNPKDVTAFLEQCGLEVTVV